MFVIICIRPAQDKVNQNPGMSGKGAYEVPSLAEQLLTIDGCSGRVNKFSSCMLFFKDYSCCSR